MESSPLVPILSEEFQTDLRKTFQKYFLQLGHLKTYPFSFRWYWMGTGIMDLRFEPINGLWTPDNPLRLMKVTLPCCERGARCGKTHNGIILCSMTTTGPDAGNIVMLPEEEFLELLVEPMAAYLSKTMEWDPLRCLLQAHETADALYLFARGDLDEWVKHNLITKGTKGHA